MVDRLLKEQFTYSNAPSASIVPDAPIAHRPSAPSFQMPSDVYGFSMRKLLDMESDVEMDEAMAQEDDNQDFHCLLEAEKKISAELKSQLKRKQDEVDSLQEEIRRQQSANSCGPCAKLNSYLLLPSTKRLIDFLSIRSTATTTPAPATTSFPAPPTTPASTPASPVASSPREEDPEMVDIGGVVMRKAVKESCITSAKGAPAKLVRNLLQAFFSPEQLAGSCAEGSRERPGLPGHIVRAIKGKS